MMGKPSRQSGFTYIGALLLVAVMGAVLASVGTVWHTLNQREKESELLYAGGQFRSAIQQYFEQTPGEAKQYPKALSDLLEDRRHAKVRRHLRKIFIDPMTGTQEWGLVMAEQGGIRGVYSLSNAEALKTSNFSKPDREFQNKILIREWRFVHGGDVATPAKLGAEAAATPASAPASSPSPASASSQPAQATPAKPAASAPS